MSKKIKKENKSRSKSSSGGVGQSRGFQSAGQSAETPSPGSPSIPAPYSPELVNGYKLKGSDLIQPTKKEYPVDEGKPKVCMVGWHTCIRVTKESTCLANKGWHLGLITQRTPSFPNLYQNISVYTDETQLIKALEEAKDKYDIFHIHNEPNALLIKAKSIIGDDKPIILDAHDFDLLRRGFCWDEEIMAITHADAIVHVSRGIENYINNLYRLSIPSITLESRCPISFIPNREPQTRTGVVYEGGIRLPEDVQDFSYRNVWPIFNAFALEGMPIDYIGPTNQYILEKYKESGANCIGGLEYNALLARLTNYQWGLSGFLQDPPKNHVKWAMTNKFFEYINCGTQPIVYNTEEQAELINKYKIGVVLNSIHNIRQQMEEHDWNELRDNLLKYRAEIAMDNHIHKLEDLYYKILG